VRTAARVDDNHQQITAALRQAGVLVLSLAAVGKGCPDLLCSLRGHLMLLEVKDGAKPPSRRKLTPEQEVFHSLWPVSVVTDVASAFDAVGL